MIYIQLLFDAYLPFLFVLYAYKLMFYLCAYHDLRQAREFISTILLGIKPISHAHECAMMPHLYLLFIYYSDKHAKNRHCYRSYDECPYSFHFGWFSLVCTDDDRLATHANSPHDYAIKRLRRFCAAFSAPLYCWSAGIYTVILSLSSRPRMLAMGDDGATRAHARAIRRYKFTPAQPAARKLPLCTLTCVREPRDFPMRARLLFDAFEMRARCSRFRPLSARRWWARAACYAHLFAHAAGRCATFLHFIYYGKMTFDTLSTPPWWPPLAADDVSRRRARSISASLNYIGLASAGLYKIRRMS